MKLIYEQLHKVGIIPVCIINDSENAINLAQALISGGINCAEITFRTESAPESIRTITKNFPQMLVGAGTVLTTDQVDVAIDSGAKFIVTPGFNPKVVGYCIKKEYPIIPGVMTPSEIEAALAMGIQVVKFFPSEAAGGINMLKVISAPYPMVQFIPTGGINSENVVKYLHFDKVLACGGSWLVKDDLIDNRNFSEITKLTTEAAAIVRTVRG